jgi:hypothetical protein
MNGNSRIPKIERLGFFDGQRLFAEDLQTLDGFNRQMRWLHNRSLHTFGIGSGFVVRGERGDREVMIEPGYAIDSEGREIILLSPQVEPVPPIADDGFGNPRFYDLTVHYPRIEDLEETETRLGICSTSGVVRRKEAPMFCWIELDGQFKPRNSIHAAQIADGEKISLARVSVKNCRLEELSIATRRNVRPERLPYIACGRTIRFTTPWRSWNIELNLSLPTRVTIGVQAEVNTAEAKFANTPTYTGRVVGDRLFLNQPSESRNFILDGVTSIAPGASPTMFTLQVLLIPGSSFIDRFERELPLNPFDVLNGRIEDLVRNRGWYVEWMGIEG